ncbi:MAG: hypothetical protein J6Y29_00205 [Clostridiales bacterium]|nr:hypothetical protein [Clostridiales bacterium]
MKVSSSNNIRKGKWLKDLLIGTAVFCFCVVGSNYVAGAAKVEEIYTNRQYTKYKLKLSEKIYKIADANGVLIVPEQLDDKSALFTCPANKKVRVYFNNSEYILVDLQDCDAITDVVSPRIMWKYKDIANSRICLKVEDEAGVYQVNDVKREDGDLVEYESARVIFSKMPKTADLSLEMEDLNGGIRIYDVFGNRKQLLARDIDLNVAKAVKNMNGDKILIKLADSAERIKDIMYPDGEVIESGVGRSVERVYNTDPGTEEILVNYGTNNIKNVLLKLDTDVTAPDVVRAFKNGDNSKLFIEIQDDKSGIKKISFYNRELDSETIIRDIMGISEKEFVKSDVIEGNTHLIVCDGVDNKKKISLENVEVDNVGPIITVNYSDAGYTINVKKDKSGLDSVKLDDVDIEVYNDYPVGDFTYNFEDLNGESSIRACDGVGNMEVLSINDVMRKINKKYKNVVGSRLSIDVEDKRGIVKITDQDDNVIERFLESTNRAIGAYKVRENTTGIKVFYKENKSYLVDLEELSSAPIVTEELVEDNLIRRCKVSSIAGIKEISYKDGRKIVFKQDMPEDIIIDCTVRNAGIIEPTVVVVVDTLGNSVKINESLE